MKIERLMPAFVDARGRITDLSQGELHHVALMTCATGSVRGNHYHRTATAYVYVLDGAFMVAWRREGEPTRLERAVAGDLVTIEPGERHALHAQAESSFLMMVHSPGGQPHFGAETVREVV